MASQLHLDDALNYLIGVLASMPEPKPSQHVNHNDRPYGSDVWIAHVGGMYWQGQGVPLMTARALHSSVLRLPAIPSVNELRRKVHSRFTGRHSRQMI